MSIVNMYEEILPKLHLNEIIKMNTWNMAGDVDEAGTLVMNVRVRQTKNGRL